MLIDKDLLKKTAAFGLVSTELLAYVGGGFLLGRFLDQKFQLGFSLTIVFSLLGLVFVVRKIIAWAKKNN